MSGPVAGRHLIHVGQLPDLDGLVAGADAVVVDVGGECRLVGGGGVGDVVVIATGVVAGAVVGGGSDQLLVHV